MWHDKLAWILDEERERYEKGEYYEIESQKWGKLDDWNKAFDSVRRVIDAID